MILRRLMMLPRFCFSSEAAQTIQGTQINTKDTNLQLSLIRLQEDTLDPSSPPLPKPAHFRPLLRI